VYVDSATTSGQGAINLHSWYNPEFDYQGSANHGTNAVSFNQSGSVSLFLCWAFYTATFEDASGAAGTYAEAIGIDANAVVRGLTVLSPSLSDYTKIVDTTLLTDTGFIVSANSTGEGALHLSTGTEIQWGTGKGEGDTNIYREAANRLFTDDMMGATNGFRQVRTVVASSSGEITLGYGTTRTTLSENITAITFPTGVDGVSIEWTIRQATSGGPYTVAGFPAAANLVNDSFTVTGTAGRYDTLTWRYDGGLSRWMLVGVVQNQA
jgi:hypothetical protein